MRHLNIETVVQVCNNTSDRKHADNVLERYVTETVMSIVTTFFSSPFSDQSTSLQVIMLHWLLQHHICSENASVTLQRKY